MTSRTDAPNWLDALDVAQRISNRTLSAEALVRACIDRIQAREDTVLAWEHIDPSGALARARALDRGPILGLLHGLPVGVKDIFDTHDMPTRYGSPIYPTHRPVMDAAAVALTRAAGGIVLGKTVTTEFATFKANKTRNPHNPAHTPGGSSSGSAAAVADGMVPLAFGTQTAGSIIRPAAFCGVVGYKPTHGLLPRAGVKPTSDTLDTVGVFARAVPDAALIVAALSRDHRLLVAATPPGSIRVGMAKTYQWPQVQPETVALFEDARGRLAKAGVPTVEIELPKAFAGLMDAQMTIMAYECAQELYAEYASHADKLSDVLRERIGQGLALPLDRYTDALRLAGESRALFADAFSGCDVLIAPSALGEAPRGLDSTGDSAMNRVWTLLHPPCVTVPVATSPRGLPLGLQIVGRIGDDARTLAAAHALHRVLAR